MGTLLRPLVTSPKPVVYILLTQTFILFPIFYMARTVNTTSLHLIFTGCHFLYQLFRNPYSIIAIQHTPDLRYSSSILQLQLHVFFLYHGHPLLIPKKKKKANIFNKRFAFPFTCPLRYSTYSSDSSCTFFGGQPSTSASVSLVGAQHLKIF